MLITEQICFLFFLQQVQSKWFNDNDDDGGDGGDDDDDDDYTGRTDDLQLNSSSSRCGVTSRNS